MNANDYLNRIENKNISDNDNYTRKELIDFAEKYAEHLITDVVTKLFSKDEMQKEYEKGFNDGNQRDFTI
jgi:Na+/phosphate symporter